MTSAPILFLKAKVAGDGSPDLFDVMVPIQGHMRGPVFVNPHMANRSKRLGEVKVSMTYTQRPNIGHPDRHKQVPASQVEAHRARGWRLYEEAHPPDTRGPAERLADLLALMGRREAAGEGILPKMRQMEAQYRAEIAAAAPPSPSQARDAVMIARLEEKVREEGADSMWGDMLAEKRARDAAPQRTEAERELIGRGFYPDGRMIPRIGDSVFQSVAGAFGMGATIRGEVKAGTAGPWVAITGASSLIGGGTSRKRDKLTEAWSVMGDPIFAQRKAARAAAEQAKKDADAAERAAEHAALDAIAATRGTLDASTVQAGDIVEDHTGAPHLVSQVIDYPEGPALFGYRLGDDEHNGGLGADYRGWQKTAAEAPEGALADFQRAAELGGSEHQRKHQRIGGAWVPVAWDDDADAYMPVTAAPPPSFQAPAR